MTLLAQNISSGGDCPIKRPVFAAPLVSFDPIALRDQKLQRRSKGFSKLVVAHLRHVARTAKPSGELGPRPGAFGALHEGDCK